MKKSMIMMICLIFAMLLIFGCEEPPKETKLGGYTIKYNENGTIDVVAYTMDKLSGTNSEGYGNCLNEAIDEVIKEYEIQQIIPYAYDSSDSSQSNYTRRLRIIARPKRLE